MTALSGHLTSPVRFWHWDRAGSGLAVNVSSQGAFVKTALPVPQGAHLTVRLELPGAPGLTLLAKVERLVVGSATSTAGLEVRFVDATPAQKRSLDGHFVRAPARF